MKPTTRLTSVLAAVGLAAAGTAAATTGASAAMASRTVLAGHLVGPLSAAISTTGVAYVSQDFAGSLVKIRPGHAPRKLYQAPKGAGLGAVSLHEGTVTFATVGKKQLIKQRTKGGSVSTVANVGAYERNNNPDADVTYGFRDLGARCLAKLPKGSKYKGAVDSNPYATDSGFGSLWVADAGGNDILRVKNGHISTVAVLPAVPLKATAKIAAGLHLPKCVVGHKYWFEPVPTDVEASHGQLYVSALTGGPEDTSLGARSRVYTISPVTGEAKLLAKGLAGATGVAVTQNGDVFVAELFGNRISRIMDGSSTPKLFRRAPQPAAVEWMHGHLYATTNALSDPAAGRLVKFGG